MAGIRDLFSLFYWFDNNKGVFVGASLPNKDSFTADGDNEDEQNLCDWPSGK